jgi:hypothetical protein
MIFVDRANSCRIVHEDFRYLIFKELRSFGAVLGRAEMRLYLYGGVARFERGGAARGGGNLIGGGRRGKNKFWRGIFHNGGVARLGAGCSAEDYRQGYGARVNR